MAIALFSYLGVETASVAAAKVRNPDRNIPRSTILGTVATAVVYLLSLTVIFGIIPAASWRRRTLRSPMRPTPSSAAPGPAT
jgi:basic amino acid/polyamine antiporter, APA family